MKKCDGCYQNWRGDWWCDNCDQWPCICTHEEESEEAA